MSRLREASLALARTGAHPVLPVERLFAIERVAAGIEARRIAVAQSWAELAERATEGGLQTLTVREERRLLTGVWRDRIYAKLAAALVEHMLALGRRSADRALIEAYLRDHPVDHPAFEPLRAAVAIAADRHDWVWRHAGRRHRLWEGPATLGAALGGAADPQSLLADAGLVGRLADGAFVSAARRDAAAAAR